MIRLSRVFSIALLLLLVSGCGSSRDEPSERPEARLLERAQEYWEARRTGDVFTFFAIESEGRPGGWLTPIVAARLGQGMEIESISIEGVSIDGDSAELVLEADVRFLMMASLGAPVFRQRVIDQWRWIDGDWYHYTPEWKPLSAVVERWGQANPRPGGAPAADQAPDIGRD